MRRESTRTAGSAWVWIALLLTLALVYWQWSQQDAPESGGSVVEPVTIAPGRQAAPAPQAPVVSPSAEAMPLAETTKVAHSTTESMPGFARRLPREKVRHALFAAHEWLPPPPKPQPPPPPVAPPLPYIYVGSLHDVPEGSVIILMQQKKMLMPALGSQVTPQWRLDREDPQAVYFTYLPLNQAVVLSKTKTATSGNVRRSVAEVNDNIPIEVPNQ